MLTLVITVCGEAVNLRAIFRNVLWMTPNYCCFNALMSRRNVTLLQAIHKPFCVRLFLQVPTATVCKSGVVEEVIIRMRCSFCLAAGFHDLDCNGMFRHVTLL